MESLETFLKKTTGVKVIDASVSYSEYVAFDLSAGNVSLTQVDAENASEFDQYIENYLSLHRASVAYGGYNEQRNLYKRSSIFNRDAAQERNIHIGLDLWIEAGTAVLAALDGKIHSFGLNPGLGNYGPTIIIQHQIENHLFYTLYGHLSLGSIEGLAIGTDVEKAQQIGTLGDASVNGDYAPHLHFQIIKEIGDSLGDYPGVCSKQDLDFYLENCPDPDLLLKIKHS